MQPLLGRELAAARMDDLQRRMTHTAQIKQTRGERLRAESRQSAPSHGRFVAAGALRLGRAVLRLRTKPQANALSC